MEYHTATSHARERLIGRELDWANRPEVFKRYGQGLASRVLPLPDCSFAAAQSLPMLLQGGLAAPGRPSLQRLANILGLAAGITQTRVHADGLAHFRSWPSAGALYPCELYVALGETWQGGDGSGCPEAGLEPGLWHHQPETHSLSLLRHGDALGVAALAAGLPAPVPGSGARLCGVVCITGIFHRSAWKYGERAYRYLLLDAGHLAENLLQALALEGFGAMWAVDFKDDAMNALLGLDTEREVCLLAIPFFNGAVPDAFEEAPAQAGPLEDFLDRTAAREASRCAPVEPQWPGMLAMHQAGNIDSRFVGRAEDAPSPEGAACFAQRPGSTGVPGVPGTPGTPGTPDAGMALPAAEAVFAGRQWPSAARCLLARRSQRRFSDAPVPAAMMHALCQLLSERTLQDRGSRHLAVALALRRVEGLEDGLYVLDRVRRTLALLQGGAPHEMLAACCLGQRWMARAAVQCYLVADLADCEARQGPRSYRGLGLAAGRLGERAYLAAGALGWGACGVGAFFDEEAAGFLQLAPTARLLYALALGPMAQPSGQLF